MRSSKINLKERKGIGRLKNIWIDQIKNDLMTANVCIDYVEDLF